MKRARGELWLALELVALTSFAFGRPVLATFGDTPALFVGRAASRLDIAGFALAVMVVPAFAAVTVGLASTALGGRVRHATHLGLVALCAGLGVWRAVHDPTGGRTWEVRALAIGAAGGVVVGLLRWFGRTKDVAASFLRWASIGAVVFLVQFLWLSPTGGHLLEPAVAVDHDATAAAMAGLGDDAPPVVVLVLDELPTASLLDGDGAIDAELFPNLAALAGDATWYRNHTTVAGETVAALPALTTGRYPSANLLSERPDPNNIFTLLGERYDVTAREAVTRLCPADLCERSAPSAFWPLLGDATGFWQRGATLETAAALTPTLPGATGPRRYQNAVRAIDQLDVTGRERPSFTFLHLLLPHSPWRYTDEGDLYARPPSVPGAFGNGWAGAGMGVGLQRHILQAQAADALVGDTVATLRDAGVYDDALVVVTADHGVSFMPFAPARGMVRGNEHEIMWSPLLVKAPGQTDGVVDDSNVLSIDVVPTIADELGIDLPWEVDGIPAHTAGDERPAHVKPYVSSYTDGGMPVMSPSGDSPYVEISTAAMFRRVLASDPVAGSGPTAAWRLTDYGDAVGRQVADLTTGDRHDGTVTVTWPRGFDDVDTAEPLPLELVAGTDLPAETMVAFALDGTVAAMGEVQDHPEGGGLLVQGMLVPWAFHDGDHELEAFVVTGDVGDPVLSPVDVAW